MTEAPQPSSAPSSAVAQPRDSELSNLAQLHRMSRTAGLGSSEYTAVNNTAVVAALLGGASFLSLFSPVLLFLPVVGVVISVIAIRQIRSSNGTQTGLALAILGLAGSLGFAGFTGLQAYNRAQSRAADEREMMQLTVDFGKALAEQRYEDAYKLTDARFQEQVKFDRFQKTLDEGLIPAFGKISGLEPSKLKLFSIEEDPENPEIRLSTTTSRLISEKYPDGVPTETRFRRTGERWLIFGFPDWFSAQQPGAGGQRPPGPPG